MNYLRLLLVLSIAFSGCNNQDDQPNPNEAMYFPGNTGSAWETKSLSSLNWNEDAAEELKEFLIEKNTKSFMILVNGRIVMEEYFDGHTQTSTWQWNSAGKTLVASTTGIAQQESLLNINNTVSQYLGAGWTSEPIEKENLITSKHLLTMTSDINDEQMF